MWDWVTKIITPVAEAISKPVTAWQERKTLEVQVADKANDRSHELNLKKIDVATELAKQGMQVEANWDVTAQEQMKHTWKDEYLLIIFTIPLIGAFIPEYQDAILKGFEVLEETPEWYLMSVLGMVAGTYGLRWLLSKSKRMKGAS